MIDVIRRLRDGVHVTATGLVGADEARAHLRPAPNRWSACEILGHLIDSAANNHRRFVMAPAKDDLIFDGYDQESWVTTQRYDRAGWSDLVALWRSYNLHLAHVMEVVPAAVRDRVHKRHNLPDIAFRTLAPTDPASLAWLMEDYVLHLEHHLRQIHNLLAGRLAPPQPD